MHTATSACNPCSWMMQLSSQAEAICCILYMVIQFTVYHLICIPFQLVLTNAAAVMHCSQLALQVGVRGHDQLIPNVDIYCCHIHC